MPTGHKQLVEIFKKDVASLSHRLQRILFQIHQYKIKILYMPRPQQFIADLESRHNHEANRDEAMPGNYRTIHTIVSCTDIPNCKGAEKIRIPISDNEHPAILSELILHG